MRLTLNRDNEVLRNGYPTGLRLERGAYTGTTDDRADRWYVASATGPVNRLGPGYRTRAEAVESLLDRLDIQTEAREHAESAAASFTVEQACEWLDAADRREHGDASGLIWDGWAAYEAEGGSLQAFQDLVTAAVRREFAGRISRISVDWENNAELWWDAARDAPDAPAAINKLSERYDHDVYVPRSEVDAILAWGAKLPGWGDGPAYAPHPIIARDIEGDGT